MAIIFGTDSANDTFSGTEEVDTIFGLSRRDKL